MKKQELYEKIGLNIKTRRHELKLKQSDVAKSTGISRPSLANIEGGRQALTLHLFYKLAGVLELKDSRALLPTGVVEAAQVSEPMSIEIKTKTDINDIQRKLVEQAVSNSAGKR